MFYAVCRAMYRRHFILRYFSFLTVVGEQDSSDEGQLSSLHLLVPYRRFKIWLAKVPKS